MDNADSVVSVSFCYVFIGVMDEKKLHQLEH